MPLEVDIASLLGPLFFMWVMQILLPVSFKVPQIVKEVPLEVDFASLLGPLFFMWVMQILLPVSE